MDDRTLLELAAKAAGIEYRLVDTLFEQCLKVPYRSDTVRGWREWNPLTIDGDALRLAVKLNLDIYHYPRDSEPYVSVHDEHNYFGGSAEEYGDDNLAATRRAIARAAAALGEKLP